MKYIRISILLVALTIINPHYSGVANAAGTRQTSTSVSTEKADKRPEAKKVLFIGDSMTGWLGERLNAYGETNGFEVATVVWDGSTIKKWASRSAKISEYVDRLKPDAILVSLGLNELAERNPETLLRGSFDKIIAAAGDTPVIWIGPPSWPGKAFGDTLDSWLAKNMGAGHYFSSLHLNLARQSKTNPHPSRAGIDKWIDAFVSWLPDNGAVTLPGYVIPSAAMPHSRGKVFVYKKMKETL